MATDADFYRYLKTNPNARGELELKAAQTPGQGERFYSVEEWEDLITPQSGQEFYKYLRDDPNAAKALEDKAAGSKQAEFFDYLKTDPNARQDLETRAMEDLVSTPWFTAQSERNKIDRQMEEFGTPSDSRLYETGMNPAYTGIGPDMPYEGYSMDTAYRGYDAPSMGAGIQAPPPQQGPPGGIESLPGYQFQLEEGIKGVERGAAAEGMQRSGKTMKELTRFAQGLASTEYDKFLDRYYQEGDIQRGRYMEDVSFGRGEEATQRGRYAENVGFQSQQEEQYRDRYFQDIDYQRRQEQDMRNQYYQDVGFDINQYYEQSGTGLDRYYRQQEVDRGDYDWRTGTEQGYYQQGLQNYGALADYGYGAATGYGNLATGAATNAANQGIAQGNMYKDYANIASNTLAQGVQAYGMYKGSQQPQQQPGNTYNYYGNDQYSNPTGYTYT